MIAALAIAHTYPRAITNIGDTGITPRYRIVSKVLTRHVFLQDLLLDAETACGEDG
jgi:hypothetical protein